MNFHAERTKVGRAYHQQTETNQKQNESYDT